MANIVEKAIEQIRKACGTEPPDWDAIRGATMTLDAQARTKEQKSAIERLKRAENSTYVQMAANTIERAFLEGKPGDDGWPRRY